MYLLVIYVLIMSFIHPFCYTFFGNRIGMLKRFLKYKRYFDISTIISITLLVVVIIGYVCLYNSGFIHQLELMNYNLKSVISAHSNKDISPDPDIVILDIDFRSFDAAERLNLGFGRWPWPRDVLAEALEFLSDAQTKAIIFRLSLKSKDIEAEDEALASVLKKIDNLYAPVSFKGLTSGYLREIRSDILNDTRKYPRYLSDADLNKSVKQYGFDETIRKLHLIHIKSVIKEVLPEKFKLDVERNDLAENSSVMDHITFSFLSHLPDIFKNSLKHVGILFFYLDDDGIVRSDTPVYRYIKNDSFYPSLTFSPYVDLWGSGKVVLTDNYVETAGKKIPIDDKGHVKINYRYNAEAYKKINILNAILTNRYLEGKKVPDNFLKSKYYIDKKFFKDKIVIIGLSLSDKDSLNVASVPTGKVLTFSEIIANQLDTYINCGGDNKEQFIKPVSILITFLVTLIFCFMTVLLILKLERILNKLAVITLSMVLFIIVSYGIFVIPELKYDMPTVTPAFIVFMASICAFLWQYKTIYAKRNEIEKLFGKFVSPQVKKVLVEDPTLINYEGQKKEMTILFCDLRGFTSISESYPTNQVVIQLNQYLSEMVNIIVNEYNGTLDKYIGDAIMAFWNDPVSQDNHAELAVKAGFAMVEKVKELNVEWVKKGWPEFKIGVGVNTGEVIVGHLGGDILLDYTVIGDNVNIASRLESMNKEYSTSILISKATYEQSKEIINVKFIADRQLKGKSVKVHFYEVVSLK